MAPKQATKMEVDNMLEIKQLNVVVGDREILHSINLSIKAGETHVLFGPNGGGKTTLLMTIMGSPKYQVTKGSIVFKGKDIVELPTDERARLGIGMSLQRPPVVRGVKTRDMVAACGRGEASQEIIDRMAEKANLAELMDRDINYGFSGGEIKRSVNIALIGQLINELLQKEHPIRDRKRAGLIITHTGHILDYVNARTGHVLIDGAIVCEGDPHEILETIKSKGYEECRKCVM